jgi:type I restriction enzyme, S subunit
LIIEMTPKIRFKDEHGNDFPDWEEKKLGEVVEVNPKSTELPEAFIYVDLESVNDGRLHSPRRITKSDAPSRAQRLLQKGDILYQTVRPYQMNNYQFYLDDVHVASTGYAQLRASSHNAEYVYQSIHFPAFVGAVLDRCTGTSYPAINSKDLAEIKLGVPVLGEQTKIADFLTAVDGRIGQLIQKKALLEDYKKGVMQQLFTQAIRFKDDHGKDFPDWEEKKLGEVSNCFSGGTPSSGKRDYYGDSIPFIRSAEIAAPETALFLTEKGYNESAAKMVEEGDLLVALYGANSGEVGIARISGAINQAILCVRSKQSVRFLFFWLEYSKVSIVKTYLQGGQGNLSGKIVQSLKIELPSLSEQTKIADFLSAIDRKIESVSTQITETQTFKRGLLQQMFV